MSLNASLLTAVNQVTNLTQFLFLFLSKELITIRASLYFSFKQFHPLVIHMKMFSRIEII